MSFVGILSGLLLGALIGGISGLVGIGGGALLIPALVYLYGMSQPLATLLLPIGFFAFWTYYKAGHVNKAESITIVSPSMETYVVLQGES
jgi:uncharacterized protein